MNTDNCSIAGETIDYGPCAMLGVYHPDTVYSSIDHGGRYAYGRQPQLMAWNMARLAETLIPLVDDNPDRAIERLGPMVEGISDRFAASRKAMLARKIGLASDEAALADALLLQLQAGQLDMTRSFDALTRKAAGEDVGDELMPLADWLPAWQQRRPNAGVMRRANPRVIPRNHHVEAVLASAVAGDLAPIRRFLTVLQSPYEQGEDTANWQDAPPDADRGYRTFCGT
ncbi:unnamed protein product [Cyprideis torosa]|uniref:Selenoprotein O n=1 Tax=Cyprideis torosa TaxID=163714 RepID=A0A7R8ZXX8_9CRUS|nr:unnamed protein product [Cyprideis torosa]CAG0910781.1 unnamed protein product [Cyprideis torosa]